MSVETDLEMSLFEPAPVVCVLVAVVVVDKDFSSRCAQNMILDELCSAYVSPYIGYGDHKAILRKLTEEDGYPHRNDVGGIWENVAL